MRWREIIPMRDGVGIGKAGGILFANLVDFDQLYGHRNDVMGFYRSLRELDGALPIR